MKDAKKDSGKIMPVFISGAKRSGTTLLQRLFDAIPGTFNFMDEAYILEYLYDIGEENIPSFIDIQKTADIDRLVDASRARQLFPFFEKGYTQGGGVVNKQHFDVKFDLDRLKEKFKAGRQDIDGGLESVWDLWVGSFLSGMGYDGKKVKMVFSKSPDYGKAALIALKHFRDPRIIMMVRDPRHAIDSLKRSRQLRKEKELHLFELLNVINDYKFLKYACDEIVRRKWSSKVMVVRYEDLVSEPKKVMSDVARFIGAEFNEKMLDPTFNGQKWLGESSFEAMNGISDSSLKRGLSVLTDWEVGYINRQLKDVMGHFGYQCDE